MKSYNMLKFYEFVTEQVNILVISDLNKIRSEKKFINSLNTIEVSNCKKISKDSNRVT